MKREGKIVVTGGAGFIGSALIWELNNRGIEDIIVVDYLGHGDKFKNLVPLRYEDYMEADAFLQTVLYEPDKLDDIAYIFHLGACSATTETDNRYLIENNFEYTKFLAHWAVNNDKRFVYASSAATYGDGSKGMDDRDEDLQRLRPLNMYGYSKHLFDLYAQRQGLLDKIVGLKFTNIFGPNEDHKDDMRSVVHKAYAQIRDTGTVKLFRSYHPDYKDGEQQRDFLYVKDAVKMALHLGFNEFTGGIFNIGRGEANTWIDLVTPIFEALEKPVNIEFIDMPETLKAKYQYYTCATTNKLESTGYYEDVTTLPDSVKDYVTNYLAPDLRLGW